jgi:hypothetical protein
MGFDEFGCFRLFLRRLAFRRHSFIIDSAGFFLRKRRRRFLRWRWRRGRRWRLVARKSVSGYMLFIGSDEC